MVWQRARPHWEGGFVNGKYQSQRVGNTPVHSPGYIPVGGGGLTQDINKAELFGWAKRAQENLEKYRREPECYDVIPVAIVPTEPTPEATLFNHHMGYVESLARRWADLKGLVLVPRR